MTTIKFSVDVPQDLALLHLDARPARHHYNGNSMMFQTVDDRQFFVSAEAAAVIERKLRDLGIQRGERILIAQESMYEHGEKTTRWNVYKASEPCGQQADGSFVVPMPPGSTETKCVALPAKPGGSRLEHTGAALYAREQAQLLVDIVAQTLEYARQWHTDLGLTRPEAIALVVAAYGKGGR